MKITDAQLARINANRNTPLVTAARANDAQCDALGLECTLRARGLDLDLIKYVYEQRTMRVGQAPNPFGFALFLDALAIGWTARGFDIATGELPAHKVAAAAQTDYELNYIADPITHEEYDAWTK